MSSKVFRQTFATLTTLDAIHQAMIAAQQQLGHTDTKTTSVYVKPGHQARRGQARGFTRVLHVVTDEPADKAKSASSK